MSLDDLIGIRKGDILEVKLRQAETEIDKGDFMFSVVTESERMPFPTPFSGLIAEVNGEVESNPELVNESAYDLGWVIILEPHDFDTELLLDPDEYVEFLAEL